MHVHIYQVHIYKDGRKLGTGARLVRSRQFDSCKCLKTIAKTSGTGRLRRDSGILTKCAGFLACHKIDCNTGAKVTALMRDSYYQR